LNMTEQLQHVEALKTLQGCLTDVCHDNPGMLDGLSIFLQHPDSTSQAESQVSHAVLNDALRLDGATSAALCRYCSVVTLSQCCAIVLRAQAVRQYCLIVYQTQRGTDYCVACYVHSEHVLGSHHHVYTHKTPSSMRKYICMRILHTYKNHPLCIHTHVHIYHT